MIWLLIIHMLCILIFFSISTNRWDGRTESEKETEAIIQVSSMVVWAVSGFALLIWMGTKEWLI